MPELEDLILRACHLANFWAGNRSDAAWVVQSEFAASSGTGVSEVRFLPAYPGWIITVTRGIWPVITCWDVTTPLGLSGVSCAPRKVAEWFRKGALFTGIVVNSDPASEACLAVSLKFSAYVTHLYIRIII
jgi:hypothetical protein